MIRRRRREAASPILRTLAYHSMFGDLLTHEQLDRLCIAARAMSREEVRRHTDALKKNRVLRAVGSYLSSYHVSPATVRDHERRERTSIGKMDIARRAGRVLAAIPWVTMVAVTGALAMRNADEDDDLDLMIVTARNRLWLTRLMVTLFVTLFFKRRKPDLSNLANSTNVTNALCLNLWLDESALAVPKDQRNLYTAHELAQMVPLINKDRVYERMMWENRWGRKYLANAWGIDKKINGQADKWINGRIDKWTSRQMDKWTDRSSVHQFVNSSIHLFIYLSNYLFFFLNILAFKMQFWYMQSRMTTERVSLSAAYFHPGDRSGEVLMRYNKIYAGIRDRA